MGICIDPNHPQCSVRPCYITRDESQLASSQRMWGNDVLTWRLSRETRPRVRYSTSIYSIVRVLLRAIGYSRSSSNRGNTIAKRWRGHVQISSTG